jgi:hypothetical protein
MKIGLLLQSSVLLLMVLLLNIQQPQGQSLVEVTPTSAVEVAPEMEIAPSNCGILAEAMAIDPLIPQAIGAWPIWIALPNVSGETKGILYMPNEHNFTTPQLEGWWVTKVAWFIPESYTGEVHVQGFNVDDHSPMYFEANAPEPTQVATLNPDHPGGFVTDLDNWAFFPSYIWVSKAGCYQIQAQWDGGMWQQVIAVGYGAL